MPSPAPGPRNADDNMGPPSLWEYRLSSVSLVEQLGNTHFVYGMWGKLYGFWEIDPSNNTSREFVPTWRLLDDNGIWLSQAKTRNLGNTCLRSTLASEWLFEADAAFAALFSDIPRQIRSLVAPMGKHQAVVLDLIWHEPELASFLDEEIHRKTEQHFLTYLTLTNAESWNRAERKRLAAQILNSKEMPRYEL